MFGAAPLTDATLDPECHIHHGRLVSVVDTHQKAAHASVSLVDSDTLAIVVACNGAVNQLVGTTRAPFRRAILV